MNRAVVSPEGMAGARDRPSGGSFQRGELNGTALCASNAPNLDSAGGALLRTSPRVLLDYS